MFFQMAFGMFENRKTFCCKGDTVSSREEYIGQTLDNKIHYFWRVVISSKYCTW